jgi:hypothetical protein
MRFTLLLRLAVIAALPGFCQTVPEGGLKPNEKPAEKLGLPPRAAPTDYQAQGKAGEITIAAEFAGHSLPTSEGPLSTEDFIVVEAGFFGPQGAKLQIADGDFSLRINGNKKTTPSEPYGVVVSNVKDPEWEPPEAPKQSKTSFGGASAGGGGGNSADPPTPPKVPFDIQRKWSIRVKRASMPVGERTLPEAGLLYFKYRGKEKSIRSLELIYSGAAGPVTLTLHP